MRLVNILVRKEKAVPKTDVVTWKGQTVFGPERLSLASVLSVLQMVVKNLAECDQLHRLTVEILGSESALGKMKIGARSISRLQGLNYDL